MIRPPPLRPNALATAAVPALGAPVELPTGVSKQPLAFAGPPVPVPEAAERTPAPERRSPPATEVRPPPPPPVSKAVTEPAVSVPAPSAEVVKPLSPADRIQALRELLPRLVAEEPGPQSSKGERSRWQEDALGKLHVLLFGRPMHASAVSGTLKGGTIAKVRAELDKVFRKDQPAWPRFLG